MCHEETFLKATEIVTGESFSINASSGKFSISNSDGYLGKGRFIKSGNAYQGSITFEDGRSWEFDVKNDISKDFDVNVRETVDGEFLMRRFTVVSEKKKGGFTNQN